MISKCENVVINRVKFSEFEAYDPAEEPIDGLKLVGYIEDADGKRNISIDYGKLLKKNGETPTHGIVIHAEAIPSSTIISNNIVCEQVAGFKVDANDLEFIQINGISEENYIKNNYLAISFANDSYAIGQECAILLHNIPANICVYTPVIGADNSIYDEISTTILKGKTVNLLIIFTAVHHSAYGHVMLPTRTFVADGNGTFHGYAPSFDKENNNSVAARLLPASNANLDIVEKRVSALEGGLLDTKIEINENLAKKTEVAEITDSITAEIAGLKTEIEKISDTSSGDVDTLNDKIKEVNTAIEKVVADNAADLNRILHVKKFNSKDELTNWISELPEDIKVKELSRTIALIHQENDTYEEYICINPELDPLGWDRLGAVDSIYASHDLMGSVQLVYDVTNRNFDEFIETTIAGDILPKRGLAVAPIALKDLYDKHNENVQHIVDVESDLDKTVEDINEKIDYYKKYVKDNYPEYEYSNGYTSAVLWMGNLCLT